MTTIIKAHGAAGEPAGIRCAAFNLDDLAEKGNLYLAEVRRQAEAMLATAREEAAQLRRRAADQGRAEALQAAHEQARAQAAQEIERRLQTLLPALAAAVTEIQGARHAWRAHWEKQAIALAVAIAARVVRREAERTPEIALTLVRESLELAAGAGRIAIRLNPRDCETLGPCIPALASHGGRSLAVEIVPDADIAPGGCRVVSEFGEIDQRLESQLARIQEELTER